MEDTSKLIIVEGPQGTGKTTLTNYLRENMPGSNLYRLSGQKDKSMEGLKYSIKMYRALINYLKSMQNVPMDMVFDRTFMTEEVYSRLGYKDYSFNLVYRELSEELNMLRYDIYYFSLYLKNISLFKERLNRPSHHNYQAFSMENSINQQNIYLQIADELNNFDNIKVYKLSMDNFNKTYDEINNILNLERK